MWWNNIFWSRNVIMMSMTWNCFPYYWLSLRNSLALWPFVSESLCEWIPLWVNPFVSEFHSPHEGPAMWNSDFYFILFFYFFLVVNLNNLLNKQSPVISDSIMLMWHQCNASTTLWLILPVPVQFIHRTQTFITVPTHSQGHQQNLCWIQS